MAVPGGLDRFCKPLFWSHSIFGSRPFLFLRLNSRRGLAGANPRPALTRFHRRGEVDPLGACRSFGAADRRAPRGNAARAWYKFGEIRALSVAKGRVSVNWSIVDDVLHLQWVEREGPVVAAPTKHGFGTTLIEQSAMSEGGSAKWLLEPEGVTWEIAMTLPDSREESVREQPKPLVRTPMERRAPVSLKRTAKLEGLRFLVIEDESRPKS